MTLTKPQSDAVRLLRGLAILSVVCIHNTPATVVQVYVRPFLNFSVGLFLFLSGMLSSAERWQPQKRLRKVLIPYVLWTALYVIFQNLTAMRAIPFAFVKALLTGSGSLAMYYIFVYCEFTLLIPWIERLAGSRYKYWGFLITPLEILFARLLPLLLGIEVTGIFWILRRLSCVGWFTFFYLGYLLGNEKITLQCKPRALWGLWALSLIPQLLESYAHWLFLDSTNCGAQLKLTSVFSDVLLVLLAYRFICTKTTPSPRLLTSLGDCSFGIYFSHLLVMQALSAIPYYDTVLPFPLKAFIALAVSFGCGLLGKKLLRKHSGYLAL
ncbi:MAG: acyltransferase [Ruminococcaceae bacterium]|nr:acyltransferase [Oscillospiraceae bacterium]